MSHRRTIPAGQALVVYKPCVALYSTLANTIPHIIPSACCEISDRQCADNVLSRVPDLPNYLDTSFPVATLLNPTTNPSPFYPMI